jgi:hypothetical protein
MDCKKRSASKKCLNAKVFRPIKKLSASNLHQKKQQPERLNYLRNACIVTHLLILLLGTAREKSSPWYSPNGEGEIRLQFQ